MPMIEYGAAQSFIHDLLDRRIRNEFPRVTGTCTWKDGWDSVTEENTPGEYFVRIGTARLGEPGSAVCPEDMAWTARTVMHERRHVYQKSVIYQGPMSGRDLDMALMDVCAAAYRGYDGRTYGFRLSELDADKHGAQDALPELKAAFPDIDWDKAMLDAYNEHNGRDRHGFVFSHVYQPGKTYQSLDEVWEAYDEKAEIYKKCTYEEPLRQFCEEDDRTVFDNRWDGKFFALLDGDGTKIGPERNREIVASVLQCRMADIAAYMPGLAPELDKIRAEYGVESDTVRRLKQAAWDTDHKDDPEDTFEAMFGLC